MDHSDPVVLTGDVAIVVTWAIIVTFIVRYWKFSPWRSERAGVALMGFMIVAGAILTFGVLVLLFGHFTGANWIRTCLYIMLVVVAARFLGILIDAQENRSSKEERGADMDIKARIKRFFRREPTLYIGVIAAICNWLVGFNFDWMTAEQSALWMVAINAVFGLWAAIKTRPIPPQAFTYAVASLAGLGAAYGMDYTSEQVGQFNSLVLAVLIFMTRGQVSPAPDAPKTGVLGDKVTTY